MTKPSALDPDRDHPVFAVAGEFCKASDIVAIRSLGHGNINETFLVELQGTPPGKYVLQRINHHVFHHPEWVMSNICQLSDHLGGRLAAPPPFQNRWDVPHVRKTLDGQNFFVTKTGETWRAIAFIDSASTHESIQSPDLAKEVGYGLGMFHSLISDFPVEKLADTLEGFHITPRYLEQFDQVVSTVAIPLLPEVDYCLNFISDRRDNAHVLEVAKASGTLKLQPIHGDPKVNNVMIDDHTGKAVCMIDLDTVKPGLVHYDIGDCLRSGCNPLGEETDQFHAVCFDLQLCQAMLEGYCSIAQNFLTSADFDYLYEGIHLISFELGLRFFTDFLAGNVYFKAQYPEHNLNRALVQFKLTESIEAQAPEIQSIIQSLREIPCLN